MDMWWFRGELTYSSKADVEVVGGYDLPFGNQEEEEEKVI